MSLLDDINDSHSSETNSPMTTSELEQDVPSIQSPKTFQPIEDFMEYIPLNHSPNSCFKSSKTRPEISTRMLKTHHNHNVSKRKSKTTVVTHVIDGWKIQESSEPFQQQENRSTLRKEEQKVFTMDSNAFEWDINDVCSFFNQALGINSYDPIIKDHLIDGIALLLLKEEHLSNTFKMPVEHRKKLLSEITILKINHPSF